MKEVKKIAVLVLVLLGNLTFLLTAQNNKPTPQAMLLPECIKSHGADSLETRKNMSLFQEDYKNKEYAYAYKYWTYLFNNAPCSYKSIHINGANIINKLIEDKAYEKRKNQLMDSLFMIFPTRIKYFGEESTVKGIWAYNLARLKADKQAEALELYKFYYENEGDKLNDFYVRDYLKVAIGLHKKNLMTKDELFALYDKLSNTAEEFKVKKANDSVALKDWDFTSKNLDKMMIPYIKGKDVDLIFLPRIKENPNDIVLINKAIKLYRADSLYRNNPNYIGLLEKSYELNPSATSAEGLGRYFDSKKNNEKANFYYEKAAELTEDKIKKEELYYKLARKNQSNLGLARQYANKILAVNPNNGNAIIILGVVYYSNACGSADDKSMAACIAVDYFNRAKSVDPSCAAEANKQIAKYSKFYLTKERAFFLNLKAGDPYTISCSGETTTVRIR